MLITDYLRSEPDATWNAALTMGVRHGTIRLPEDEAFDLTNKSHWKTVVDRFEKFCIKPIIIEPMPNSVHDHIKIGDSRRDESIEKVIKMFPIMKDFGIDMICFNFMAHIGWLRTNSRVCERGGAFVTEFSIDDFKPTGDVITEKELWDNYSYFINAVLPEAEKNGIRLALHPDDPPCSLGGVSRIMTSAKNIKKALYDIKESDNLGLTMCQATFKIMGEDLQAVIEDFKKKIFFVHFRNTVGTIEKYRETFHDNGSINMAEIMDIYYKNGIDVPVRVDHVPTMPGEESILAGYDTLGRYFAVGYLKGIIDSCNNKYRNI